VAEDVKSKVIHKVAGRMDVSPDQVTEDTHFVNDLQMDSLDVAELVIDLEEEFNLSITDEEAQKLQTVGQAIKYIEGKQQQTQ
jgi:acyl carrier protein